MIYKWTKMLSICPSRAPATALPIFPILKFGESMKNLMLRSGALLACALSLASCGGSNDGNLYLSGTVYNMTKSGMKLSLNGGTPIDIERTGPGGTGTFYFEGLDADDRFNITVASQPAGSECIAYRNVGKMGAYSVDYATSTAPRFECYNLPQNLSGRLSAPLSYDITLNNGRDRVTVKAGQTTFTFTVFDANGKPVSGTVGNGEPYGVTVLPPHDKTCTVENGVGTMVGDFNNVIVTCQ